MGSGEIGPLIIGNVLIPPRFQLKRGFWKAHQLAASSGAGSSYDLQSGIQATTQAEQSVINDFAKTNPV